MSEYKVRDGQNGRLATLVIGAGLEGMGVALHLAEAGYPVHLLDSAPWIGGSLHLLDRTFPTDSCGLCLMSPVQPAYCPTFECSLHKDITLLPHAEILDVAGGPGAWQATVEHKPRYVIDEKCTRCGLCLEVCPEVRPAVYEGNLAPQRAIYRPPSRAVPDAPVIDMAYCTRCGKCVVACPTGAIDLDQATASQIVEAGAVVLCPGYEPFDARLKGEYGYGLYENVVTSLQFERMTSAPGSTGGRILRPSDGRVPRRIAFIHCVGSRDTTCAREYCSSVCCMYTAKQVAAAVDIVPDLQVTVFHMDIRAGGKGYEAYFKSVEALPGVTYRRSMVSSLFERQQSKDLRLVCQGADGKLQEMDFDLVVLAVGLAPAEGMRELAERLGIELDAYGFCRRADVERGVFVVGTYREPMDIPAVVVDAAQVAGQVSRFLKSRQDREGTAAPVEPVAAPWRDVRDEVPQVGVFIQTDGSGGTLPVDLDGLMDYTARLPGVVSVMPVHGGQMELRAAVELALADQRINRAVLVSDARWVNRSPWWPWLRRLGLPPDAVEWVNVQDGCALVHQDFRDSGQAKARQMVAMAAGRLTEGRVLRWPAKVVREAIHPMVLVIGGGPAGLSAALGLAGQGHPVHLVERSAELGGQLRDLHSLLSGEDPQVILSHLVTKVAASALIQVHTEAQVVRVEGRAGRFVSTLDEGGQPAQVEHGAIIVATGGAPVVPRQYAYGSDPRVLTQRELEARLAGDPDAWRGVERVVMIQCVESRDEVRPYCSQVCCGQAVKNALAIKRLSPATEVDVLYREVRTPGLQELAYQEARQRGVAFLRYELPARPVVRRVGDRLQVETTEPILGQSVTLDADWVVLSTGIAPLESENEKLARLLGVSLDADGFFQESHPKMRPLDFTRPGLYLCGLAHGPCSLPESIAQGEAAAMRAAAFLAQGALQPAETAVAVSDRLCCGCGLCVKECPYGARFLDVETGKAQVIETLCLGCGACAVVCRNAATQQHGYEKARVMAAIEAAVG